MKEIQDLDCRCVFNLSWFKIMLQCDKGCTEQEIQMTERHKHEEKLRTFRSLFFKNDTSNGEGSKISDIESKIRELKQRPKCLK